jgi:hypothetical protein
MGGGGGALRMATTVITGIAIGSGSSTRGVDTGVATGVTVAEDDVERFQDFLRRKRPILLPTDDKPLLSEP